MTELTLEKAQIERKGILAQAALKETGGDAGAVKMRALKRERGPAGALDAYRSNKPIDEVSGAEAIEKMGYERRPDGTKNRTGEERVRYQEAAQAAGIIEQYLRGGIESLGDPGDRAAIMDALDRATQLWPETSGMNAVERKRYIEKRVRNNQFMGRVKETYAKALEASDSLGEGVVEAERELVAAQTAEEAARKRYDANITQQGKINAQLALFDVDASGTPRAKLKELNDLITGKPTIEKNILDWRGELDDLESDLEYSRSVLRAVLSGRSASTTSGADTADKIQLEITSKRRDIAKKKGDISTEEAKLVKIQQLEGEKQALEQKKIEVEVEEAELKSALDAAVYELTSKRAIFEDAKNSRATHEDHLVTALKNVWVNAALDDVEATISEWEGLRSDRLTELKEKIGDMAAKKILDCDKRWTEQKPGSTKPKDIRINKAKIEEDYTMLLNEGPEALMRKILKFSGDENGIRLFTDAEIENKLADPEFIAEVQNELISQLLFRRLNIGKKPTEAEVSIIATSKWGEGMFQAAAAKDQRVADAMAIVDRKYGATTGEKIRNLAKDPKAYGMLVGILALLLGSPFLLAAGGVAGSAYMALGEAANAPFIG